MLVPWSPSIRGKNSAELRRSRPKSPNHCAERLAGPVGSSRNRCFVRLFAGGNRIRTIGPAEGARHPRGVGSRSRPTSVGGESRQRRHAPVLKPWPCHAEPMVRIHLPPAESRVRTWPLGIWVLPKCNPAATGCSHLAPRHGSTGSTAPTRSWSRRIRSSPGVAGDHAIESRG
jgi:hypothetical protein